MIDAGYLALLLALLQPFVAFPLARKKLLAALFITGGVLLPVGIFLIHYVGLAYSPFSVIGWASIVADSAGALLVVALLGEAWGMWNYARGRGGTAEIDSPHENSWSRRILLSGGTVLVLLGFLHGAWYAAADLYRHEAEETTILHAMVNDAAAKNLPGAANEVMNLDNLGGENAIRMLAHSHIIEFGL